MTKKENLIQMLSKELNEEVSKVEKGFEIINKREWAIFCSYMADDRDHPEERTRAEKDFEKESEEFNRDFMFKMNEIFRDRTKGCGKYYHDNFHKMSEQI